MLLEAIAHGVPATQDTQLKNTPLERAGVFGRICVFLSNFDTTVLFPLGDVSSPQESKEP